MQRVLTRRQGSTLVQSVGGATRRDFIGRPGHRKRVVLKVQLIFHTGSTKASRRALTPDLASPADRRVRCHFWRRAGCCRQGYECPMVHDRCPTHPATAASAGEVVDDVRNNNNSSNVTASPPPVLVQTQLLVTPPTPPPPPPLHHRGAQLAVHDSVAAPLADPIESPVAAHHVAQQAAAPVVHDSVAAPLVEPIESPVAAHPATVTGTADAAVAPPPTEPLPPFPINVLSVQQLHH